MSFRPSEQRIPPSCYACHPPLKQVLKGACARRNLALLIDFSSSGQTPLYASHINIACNFIPLPLLFAQKPRFCASAKALHFFRRLSRNDKGGYNIFHKIQPPRGRLCDRAAALKQLLLYMPFINIYTSIYLPRRSPQTEIHGKG